MISRWATGVATGLCLLLAAAPAGSAQPDEEPGEGNASRARIAVLSIDGLQKATFALGEPFVVLGEGFGPLEGGTIFVRWRVNQRLTDFSTDEQGRFRAEVVLRGVGFGGAAIVAGTQSAVASAGISVVRPSSVTRNIPAHDRNMTLLGTIAAGLAFAGLALILGARRKGGRGRDPAPAAMGRRGRTEDDA